MPRSALPALAVVLVTVLAIAAHALTTGPTPGAPAPDPAMDAFTARAAAAAGGPVEGPRIFVTAAAMRVEFDRGACRVVMRLDRDEPPTAANATVDAGRGCPAA